MKKFIISILLIVISVCNCSTTVHEEGAPGGTLFFSGNGGSKSAWEGEWQSKKVRYPVDGEYPRSIGYIKIDNNMDSSYSTATIKSGGLGSKFVEIEFYAPAFRGYDNNIEIRAPKA